MSLDVHLKQKTTKRRGTGVYVRENGQTRELGWDEIWEKFPDFDATQSDAEFEDDYVFGANITHNLGRMARAVSEEFYLALWRPEEMFAEPKGKDIAEIVRKGYEELLANPETYKLHDSPNGWGVYKDFVPWVREYAEALDEYPDALVSVCR